MHASATPYLQLQELPPTRLRAGSALRCVGGAPADEGVWQYLKRMELKNVICQNCSDLRAELRLATVRLRRKRDVIQGCIKHAGLIL